jgi:hypothetical protein
VAYPKPSKEWLSCEPYLNVSLGELQLLSTGIYSLILQGKAGELSCHVSCSVASSGAALKRPFEIEDCPVSKSPYQASIKIIVL